MARRLDSFFDRLMQKRFLGRWGQIADAAPDMDLESLRGARSRARAMRRQLDRVIHQAEHRLSLPVIGSNAMRKPLGTEWSWRPDLWRGQIPVGAWQSPHL
jgi:Family of unknown function (DUF6478)